jgi:CubicO group peptidase (beta-lactamase class C family)
VADIKGAVSPGFERVREVFGANFDSGLEVGAAFAAYHHGARVVDLWGGLADPGTGRQWEEDTVVLVFSSTKGATALCANMLAERGKLDMEAPVTAYWPEFAEGGKQSIPVKYLLSHQAGLAWVDGEMSLEDALAWDPVVAALGRQSPSWPPGQEHGYHATTYGWLVGELVRRVSGRSLGSFFHEEIARPLGLSFWIGLPESEEPRVSPLIPFALPEGQSLGTVIESFLGPDTDIGKALAAPGGAFKSVDAFNLRSVRAAEVPAANGVSDARSLARMYASTIGEVDGFRSLGPEQLARATTQLTSGPDRVIMGLDLQFGLGFMVRSSLIPFGGPRGFGHFGMGGSAGWADPDADLAVGYVMNRMDPGVTGDARAAGLIQAAYESAANASP